MSEQTEELLVEQRSNLLVDKLQPFRVLITSQQASLILVEIFINFLLSEHRELLPPMIIVYRMARIKSAESP